MKELTKHIETLFDNRNVKSGGKSYTTDITELLPGGSSTDPQMWSSIRNAVNSGLAPGFKAELIAVPSMKGGIAVLVTIWDGFTA